MGGELFSESVIISCPTQSNTWSRCGAGDGKWDGPTEYVEHDKQTQLFYTNDR